MFRNIPTVLDLKYPKSIFLIFEPERSHLSSGQGK